MNPTSPAPEQTDQPDPRLAGAVDVARAVVEADAAALVCEGAVGDHVGVQPEGPSAATHLFEANYPGYRGWRWAVTVATVGDDEPVTISEVVLLPGPDALIAPEWVPWDQRVRAGDLGVGDLLPTAPDDPRLVPGYLESDDPAVEDVVRELGLGRHRVLGRDGRLDAAARWQRERGPLSDMAVSAPGNCGTCGFYLPIAGSLGAAFGLCGNELAPADGRAVHVEFGCGAHSEVEVDPMPLAPVAEVVYDDAQIDQLVRPARDEAVAADAAMTDAVVTDAVVTDAVMTADAEVSVPAGDEANGHPAAGEPVAVEGEPVVDGGAVAVEGEPVAVEGGPVPGTGVTAGEPEPGENAAAGPSDE